MYLPFVSGHLMYSELEKCLAALLYQKLISNVRERCLIIEDRCKRETHGFPLMYSPLAEQVNFTFLLMGYCPGAEQEVHGQTL